MGVLVRMTAVAALVSSGTVLWAVDAQLLLATSLSPIIQNERADEEGMVRITNDRMLTRFVRSQILVRVPAESKTYYLKGIPSRYRYLRPQSKRFLDQLGGQYFREFGKKLRVTSMVRTGQFQLQLARYNGNAAPATGKTQSSHLTGATLDISKAVMGAAERDWMREKILTWTGQGYLYGIEEHAQPTFHIMVYKTFPAVKAAPVKPRTKVARLSADRPAHRKAMKQAVHKTSRSSVVKSKKARRTLTRRRA